MVIFVSVILAIAIYEIKEMYKANEKKEIVIFILFVFISFLLKYLVSKQQFKDSLFLMLFHILDIKF